MQDRAILICNSKLKTATSKKAQNVRSFFENKENKEIYDDSFQAKIDRAALKAGKQVQVA